MCLSYSSIKTTRKLLFYLKILLCYEKKTSVIETHIIKKFVLITPIVLLLYYCIGIVHFLLFLYYNNYFSL